LTVLARHALQHDLLLATLNIGVTVQDRHATLWGAVHAPDLSKRAEDAVRHVPGIASVKNDLRIDASARLVSPQLVQTWSPKRSEHASAANKAPKENLASFSRWTPPATINPPAVHLGEPIARAPINPISPVMPSDLAASLNQLRNADARYRQLRIDTDGAIITLRGTVRRWEDALDLAGSISHVTGVERVILDRIETNRHESLQVP
jgi:hypothetical protein